MTIQISFPSFSAFLGVTLAQLVKASVGQGSDVQRFESHLGHNWLSEVCFL